MVAPLVVNDDAFIELIDTQSFFDVNLRLAYRWQLKNKFSLELNGGVQNMFDSFQSDFSTGPTRDSDFVFGPMRPRTFFMGVKIGNFL
jgi:outer membrane receptor for ferrienterochelin and colicins